LRSIVMPGLAALAAVLATAASGSAASASVAPQVAAHGLLPPAAVRLPATAFPPAAAFPLAGPGHVRTATAAPADELADVSCLSAKDCVAVGVNGNGDGGNGSPLAETWNGTKWRTTVSVKLPSGADGGSLSGVSCKSAMYCVAVGSYAKGGDNYVLAETWNGKAWTPAEPAAPGGGFTTLSRVSCATVKSCLAVGEDTTNNGLGDTALAEYWNGKKWAEEKPAAPSGSGVLTDLSGVSCVSATYCVTVGMSLGASSSSQPAEVLLADSWNGRAFTKLKAPPVPSGVLLAEPTDVSCTSAKNCVAVGLNLSSNATSASSTALAESWNGKNWTAAKVAWPKGTTDEALLGAWCASAKSCVAVGATGLNVTSSNNSGRAAAVSFNGKAWSVATVPAPAKGKASILDGAACLSATDCVAVGAQGSTSSANSNGLAGFWNGKSWKLITAI
jgi:hypothetical protein